MFTSPEPEEVNGSRDPFLLRRNSEEIRRMSSKMSDKIMKTRISQNIESNRQGKSINSGIYYTLHAKLIIILQ